MHAIDQAHRKYSHVETFGSGASMARSIIGIERNERVMFSFAKLTKGSWFIRLLQMLLNLSLIILGLVLCFFMFRELYYVVFDAIAGNNNVHDILEKVLVFFLYFVFVSMIVKYFNENYHFPLRYLIYLGITGTLRFIIVNHDNPLANLLLSMVILVLMIGYLMLTPRMKQISEEKDKME